MPPQPERRCLPAQHVPALARFAIFSADCQIAHFTRRSAIVNRGPPYNVAIDVGMIHYFVTSPLQENALRWFGA